MGGLLARYYKSEPVRIIMIGLDAAGKTTLLYKMKMGQVVTTIPTIGFNVEEVHHKNCTITCWDVGGRDKVRPLWRHYYQNCTGLVFVVDSNDRERLDYSKDEIKAILKEDGLAGVPLLILANKQDLSNPYSVPELQNKLELENIKDRQWYIQGCCAQRGDFEVGLEWLVSVMSTKKLSKSVSGPITETFGSKGSAGVLQYIKSIFGLA